MTTGDRRAPEGLAKSRLVSDPDRAGGSRAPRPSIPRPESPTSPPPRRRGPLLLGVLALLVIGLAGVAAWLALADRDADEEIGSTIEGDAEATDGGASDGSADGSDGGAPDDDTDDGTDPDGATGDDAAGDGATGDGTASGSILDAPAPDGPHLDARLDLDAPPGDGMFVLTGVLPEGPEGDELLELLDVAYFPFSQIDVERRPDLAPGPWMTSSGGVIPLLGSIISGAVRISPDGLQIEGTGSEPEIATLVGAIDLLAGDLPVDASGLVEVEQTEPSYDAVLADGVITIDGRIPDRATADTFVAAASAAYGAENVVDRIVVDPGVHRAFWMTIVPPAIQLLESYPAYRFTIADGGVSAELQSDAGFEPDSAVLSEEAARVLPLWYAVLVRAPTAVLTIYGHTDSDGSEAYNLELAQARAEAIRSILLQYGAAPERVRAVGVGEAEPVAPNDTPENKARNRRVEFEFG